MLPRVNRVIPIGSIRVWRFQYLIISSRDVYIVVPADGSTCNGRLCRIRCNLWRTLHINHNAYSNPFRIDIKKKLLSNEKLLKYTMTVLYIDYSHHAIYFRILFIIMRAKDCHHLLTYVCLLCYPLVGIIGTNANPDCASEYFL